MNSESKTIDVIGGGTPIGELGLNPILEWLLRSRWIDSVESFDAIPEDWKRILGVGKAQALIEDKNSLPDIETLAHMLGLDGQILGNESVAPANAAHSAVRLMDGFFPVRNQGERGSCTAFATTALCEYGIGRKARLSEQFLYWATKEISETSLEDLADGAMFEAVQSALDHYGICPADDWVYAATPSGWSVAANPSFEHEGDARILALKHAAQYRVHGFRQIPQGAIAQFRHSLARGFPVVVGIPCFMSWIKSEWTKKKGEITLPLACPITLPYPFKSLDALAGEMRSQRNEESEPLSRKEVENQAAAIMNGIASSLEFIPQGAVPILQALEQEFAVFLIVEHCAGRHALCLAGYVDDENVPGGGYFIARNSWGSDWASESPETPGYALIPYAYFTANVAPGEVGISGFTFAEMPAVPQFAKEDGSDVISGQPTVNTVPFKSTAGTMTTTVGIVGMKSNKASFASGMVVTPAPADAFGTWLTERSSVLDRPVRDKDGVLLRSGTSVLVPDLSKPLEVLRDTMQNREKLRTIYDVEVKKKAWKQLVHGIRKVADESFGRHSWILSFDDIRESLAEIGVCPKNAEELRSALLAVQKTDQNTYALCINQFGREELRHASVLGSRKRVTE